ncbi:MAG: tripartite tricarboxylate transporter substrate binding protein [Pseudomonadota bacterium]
MTESISRRNFLHAGATMGVGLGSWTAVSAQGAWPSAPVKIVVPFSPGGATDVVARLLGDGLQKRVGQSFIIDNRTGAGGSIGTAAVAKALPDGLTLTVGLTSSLLVNQFQYKTLPYNPRNDLILLSQIAIAPMAICVGERVPARNMKELKQYLAERRGKVSYGTYGNGSYSHLVLEHMNKSLGADMVGVHYRGEAAVMAALLAAEVDIGVASGVVTVPQAKAGKIRVVGIAGPQRMPALADVPTLIEQGMTDEAYRVGGWVALAAPAKTPANVIDRLARETALVVQSPAFKERVGDLGLIALGNGPKQFKEAYEREYPIWKRMFEASGAKIED